MQVWIAAVAFLVITTAAAERPTTEITLSVGKQVFNGTGIKRLVVGGTGPMWTDFRGGARGLLVNSSTGFRCVYTNLIDPKGEPGRPDLALSIMHQHGLTPPMSLDGMPFVSSPPFAFRETSGLVDFALHKHNQGSYFAHAHYGFQHLMGLSVPIVVDGESAPAGYPLAAAVDSAEDIVLAVVDLCPYSTEAGPATADCFNPLPLYGALAKAWDEEKKNFDFKKCQAPGSGDDVSYLGHAINEHALLDGPAKVLPVVAGEYLRLRFYSDASMTSYEIRLSDGLSGTIIATDGQWAKPNFSSSVFYLAVAQRLDVLVQIPPTKGPAPRAWTVTAVASGKRQQAGIVLAEAGAKAPPLSPTAAKAAPDVGAGPYAAMEQKLSAWTPLPAARGPTVHFDVNLTGDNGFDSINTHGWQIPPIADTYIPNPHPIQIHEGDRVCLRFRNFNADDHAMHLHGHMFQVTEINGDKKLNGAIRETILVQKGECNTAAVCFDADNPGSWFLHCHMSFHAAAGMLTTIEYVA
jgi:FtsP/CotA-like multicopper oxidase with cupredoxin domain